MPSRLPRRDAYSKTIASRGTLPVRTRRNNSVSFSWKKARELLSYDRVILLCGHYEGIDCRVIEEIVDEDGYGKISVDYKIKFDKFFSRRNILEIEVMPS